MHICKHVSKYASTKVFKYTSIKNMQVNTNLAELCKGDQIFHDIAIYGKVMQSYSQLWEIDAKQ